MKVLFKEDFGKRKAGEVIDVDYFYVSKILERGICVALDKDDNEVKFKDLQKGRKSSKKDLKASKDAAISEHANSVNEKFSKKKAAKKAAKKDK